MLHLSQTALSTLEITATSAAAYLDACDAGAKSVRLDPAYYQACGNLLMTIFSVTDAHHAFPMLVEQSAAAREVAESIKFGNRIEVSLVGYYPQLAAILKRVAQ